MIERKTLRPWIAQHLGPVRRETHQRYSSSYSVEGPVPTVIVAINKIARLADYYKNGSEWQTGCNEHIWQAMAAAKCPVRLVICHEGRVYIHRAPDLRETTPDIRATPWGGEDKRVAWWPLSDFERFGAGEQDPSPKAEQPSIIDLLGEDDQ